jgi:hypothetical protein
MSTTVPTAALRTPFGSAFAIEQFGTGYPGWVATPYSVATLLRARTKDSNGQELGYWSDETRPTINQVLEYIRLACGELLLCTGAWLPPQLWMLSEHVIALKTALLIELAYWPEQIMTDQSSYLELKKLFDADSRVLCEAASQFRPEDLPDPNVGLGDTSVPLYYFGDGSACCQAPRIVYDPTTERTMVWGGRVSELPLAYYTTDDHLRPIVVNKIS